MVSVSAPPGKVQKPAGSITLTPQPDGGAVVTLPAVDVPAFVRVVLDLYCGDRRHPGYRAFIAANRRALKGGGHVG